MMTARPLVLLILVVLHGKQGNLSKIWADYGCECGQQVVSEETLRQCQQSLLMPEETPYQRIVNGCDAPGVPWFVHISMKGNLKCGGSLINKFWVLSAAHCFCNKQFLCDRDPKDERIIHLRLSLSDIKMRIGADSLNDLNPYYPSTPVPPSSYWFSAAEIIPHYKYQYKVKHDGKIYEREDYDFALIRLDYPVADEISGIGIIKTINGDHMMKNTIMPVCLPPPDFKDTLVKGKVVGYGIKRVQKKCFTNKFGPEVFSQCAKQWLPSPDPKDWIKTIYGDYENVHHGIIDGGATFNCDTHTPPPSLKDPICEDFYDTIEDIRVRLNEDENVKLTEKEKNLFNRNKLTSESMIFPSVDDLMNLEEQNKSYCFMGKLEDRAFGWCATCNPYAKENEAGYCNDDKIPSNDEIARPEINKGWGFCDKSCGERVFSVQKLQGADFTILPDSECHALGNNLRDGEVWNNVNIRTELCAAFISQLNSSVLNYTKGDSDRKKFDFFNVDEYKNERRHEDDMFRAKRIVNIPYSNFTNKTDLVIGGIDSCKGDSGGPLVTLGSFKGMNNVMRKNVAVLIGVVSRGKDCAALNIPGVYGRVKVILPWIRSIADKPQKYVVKDITGHTVSKEKLNSKKELDKFSKKELDKLSNNSFSVLCDRTLLRLAFD